MPVTYLKIKENLRTGETTDRNIVTPPQKQDATEKQNIASSSNASFNLVMSQLGIADQQAFNAYQAKQWQEAVIEKKQLAVLTCEVDYYQEYLQHYGEQGVSFMMVAVALAMKNVCLSSDCFVAHFGQNRLVILVKGGDQNSLQNLADNLCQAVRSTKTEHKYSKVDDIVTVSVGFSATQPSTMSTIEKQALRALKNAKILGKNKVSHSHNKQHQAQIQKLIKQRHASLKQKQQKLAPKTNTNAPNRSNHDLFADPLIKEAKKPSTTTKMYRGQPVLNTDTSATTSSQGNTTETKKITSKCTLSGKIYRGQVVKN